MAPNRVVVSRSRFEVDVNRPPDGCVYRVPHDAWGIEVWRDGLPDEVVDRSLDLYRGFCADVEEPLRGSKRWRG